jgi:hydroxyethylthiazole kinase
MISALKKHKALIEDKKPLVLCLTNYVTVEFIANCILAVGAVPLMCEDETELEELLSISQALCINIGTLDEAFFVRARMAAKIAFEKKVPVILDPVGAGASVLRTKTSIELAQYAKIIRGNASEILALTGTKYSSRGVEATHDVKDALKSAETLALEATKVCVVSGASDLVTDGVNTMHLPYGAQMMSSITGMGCALTAVIAAFRACHSNAYQAALHGTLYFGLCGQLTATKTQLPGTFKSQFIDMLYQPNWDFFENSII